MDISFEHELPSGQLLDVRATITPGRSALQPTIHRPGEPAEDHEVTGLNVMLRDTSVEFDIFGVYVKVIRYWRRDGDEVERFELLSDLLHERALAVYEERSDGS